MSIRAFTLRRIHKTSLADDVRDEAAMEFRLADSMRYQ